MPFPPDEAGHQSPTICFSIFIQTLLYGAYTVVFILTVWVLLSKRRKRRPIRDPMLWISLIMFVMATVHIAINYTRVIRAFITFRDAPGGPAAFFNQLSEFTQIFGSTIYIAQTLIGDSVVLYRCYLVWGDSRVIVFPCILLLGSTASGVGILYSFARVVPEAEIFVEELQQWIVSFFSLTLATNIICTGLVALRIWWMNRAIMNFASNSYHPIIFLVLESGAVYSATLTTLLILYKTGSWFQYVLLDAISPIVGLVFSMIIIRIGMGITTARGSSAAMSNTAAQQATRGTRGHPIQFAHNTRRPSTLATEFDLNELELRPTPVDTQDYIQEHKKQITTALPLEP
ncbi:hypothetical protein C8Q76DRAFT_798856 [Earliella scabrosa]|nr:hypothetical protein C8Q76DRAFT_798856 [Earliella scabrosa]